MRKEYAIKLLGGSTASAAEALGVTYQAVSKWPDVLSSAVTDRVIAAVARADPKSWPKNWAQINASSQRSDRAHRAENSTPAD